MKLIQKIKAFFRRNEETVEWDLAAAEIREGKAFLHTKGEEPKTYLVRADDIEIHLNKQASIREVDILIVKKPSREEQRKEKETEKEIRKAEKRKGEAARATAADYDLDRFKKRKFSISVYPEEYDAIQATMKEYGYKQSDFVLACINTATKTTMEKAHRRIVRSHKELLLERQALIAKQLKELAKSGEQTG